MPKQKGRGKKLRTRTVKVPGSGGREYMRCDVYEKPGPQGGKTVCGPVRKKQRSD